MKSKCQVQGCWQEVKCRGFCDACYSWNQRVGRLGLSDLHLYVRKLERFSGRLQRIKTRKLRKVA